MKKNTLLVCTLVLLFLSGCKSQKNSVYFIPSLHGLHKVNEKYTYDSLNKIIGRLDPDIIAVEIRPEDINRDSTYLSKNYPYEMRMMKYWFPEAQIAGFDWLGEDIEEKPIPDNYWQEMAEVKKLEMALAADSIYSSKRATCSGYVKERLEILKNSSLREIVNSRDSILTRQYYECLATQYENSKYEALLDFYEKRNSELLNNIRDIIKSNKNKTIVILTGDDHYVYLKGSFPHNLLFD
ncbi:MAG TPA: hypothetical protein VFM82_05230 [Flavobacteriaceae bacterium]|nr:hypothetical protein [Flavobacteriaceae bacterium]